MLSGEAGIFTIIISIYIGKTYYQSLFSQGFLSQSATTQLHTQYCFHSGIVFFWLCPMACEILAPQPGIESLLPAMEEWSLNHWTAREVCGV